MSEASEKAQAQSFQEAPEGGKADVEEAPEVMINGQLLVNWLEISIICFYCAFLFLTTDV